MKREDARKKVDSMRKRLAVLEKELEDPALYQDLKRQKTLFQEREHLLEVFHCFDAWERAEKELAENRDLLQTEQEEEFRSLLEKDIALLEKESAEKEKLLTLLLLPPDPNDSRNIILEMRPGTGGDEAALFTGQLFHAYCKFAEKKEWLLEVLDLTETPLGGVKEVIFSVSGKEVYTYLKFESGVHRVQRVPVTETSGRIHTSTITVSVLPEAEETDEIIIRQEDLEISTFRSSGPGGQNVNRTDSAVRIVHKPSGLVVASQQERSQIRNREIALRILKSRLLEIKRKEEAAAHALDKRLQIGTGERSERIRTYNFPQNRITDHRFNISAYDLPSLMEGAMDLILDRILEQEKEKAMQELTNPREGE